MRIGVPKERLSNETRVAATPKTVEQILNLGFSVAIEKDAGKLSNFSDLEYMQSGAIILEYSDIWNSDIILKVNAPEENEIALLKSGSTLISFIWPRQNPELMKKMAERKINVIAMDSVPRISRAQSFDALSSIANVSGYRAIIEAAYEFEHFFGGQITAAGKVSPAKVMIIGAGVAGLAAIGAAKRLGAIVYAFDTCLELQEQVESMGAEFLKLYCKETISNVSDIRNEKIKEFLKAEIEFISTKAKEVDIIVTTALNPGKPAPKLITKKTIDSMKSGSIIVDLAAKSGGNCEYTVINEVFRTSNNVKIIGYTDFSSRLSTQSSELYSRNLVNLLRFLCKKKDGSIVIDFEDIILRTITVIRNGEINSYTKPLIQDLKYQPKEILKKEKSVMKKPSKCLLSWNKVIIMMIITISCLISSILPKDFLSHFTVFTLSCVVGYYVVWNVSYSLHTPLISLTNAISGIIIIGAILQIGHVGFLIRFLSFIAILISSINIFGGFTVTHRMLKMFRKS